MNTLDTGRRTRKQTRGIALFVASVLMVAACSSSDDGGPAIENSQSDDATSDEVQLDDYVATPGSLLAEIGLSADVTEPLDTVALTGVAADDTADLELWIRTADGDVGVPLYVDETGAHFSAPLHPASPRDGGAIELYVARGDERGSLLGLDVGPLADAPGAWDEFVEAFVEAIDLRAQEFGTSFSELQATGFDDVEPLVQPIKLAQAYVDDGGDSDLESFSTYSELTDEDRSMLDAVTAQARLIDLVTEPGQPAGLRSGALTNAGRTLQTLAMTNAAVPQVSRPTVQTGDCRVSGLAISGAQDLSDAMTVARLNNIRPGSEARKTLDSIGTVTTVGGFVPGAGWVVAGFGTAFVAYEAYRNATSSMYPSLFTELTAELTDDKFPEDFQAPNGWNKVEVTARSRGWSADADIAKTLLAGLSTVTSGAANLRVVDGVALDASLYLRDNTANAAVRKWGGVINFCPKKWTVDVRGMPWSSGRVVQDLFTVDSDEQTFQPNETGLNLPVEDTLKIEVDPTRFGGEHIDEEYLVSVKPISLDSVMTIDVDSPGDRVDIEVSIVNALDTELDWDTEQGGWQGDAQLTSAGEMFGPPTEWTREHVSASKESEFPYFVTIDSASDTGLRADKDAPPRRRVVQVRLKQLFVTPTDGRVLKGATLPFFATDRDRKTVAVDWNATGGSIGADGVYQAGDIVGTYTVTATSKANSDLATTVTVEVDEADCLVGQWRLREQDLLDQISSLAGGGAVTHLGGQYLITFEEDGSYVGQRAAWNLFIPESSIKILIDSIENGTWIVDAAAMRLAVNETSSSATVSMTIGGLSIPDQQFNAPGFGGEGTYECSGEVMTTTLSEGEVSFVSTLDRIG